MYPLDKFFNPEKWVSHAMTVPNLNTHSKEWDCIIIGGGIIGLCTAYSLTKVGLTPLVLEQFNLPHTRGSSHGQSRLIRKAHIEDAYAALCAESYNLWKTIEKEAEKQLMVTTGLLLLQNGKAEGLQQSRAAMGKLNLDYEWFDGKQLRQKYPMVRYSEDYKGLLDKTASIILADRALSVLTKLVESGGGVIKDGFHVKSIHPGALVTVETNRGIFRSKKLVIATGPWSQEILTSLGLNLPLKTMNGLHTFWHDSRDDFNIQSVPMMYDNVEGFKSYTSGVFAVFPSIEYPGLVKVVTRGEPPPFYCHPDERDKQSMQPMIDLVAEYIKQHFPSVETKPSIVEPCMYCMTPDKMGIIDHHPQFPNIMIGTAFSGKGFMLAPLVGKTLSDMVTEQKPQWNMSTFSLHRFGGQSKL